MAHLKDYLFKLTTNHKSADSQSAAKEMAELSIITKKINRTHHKPTKKIKMRLLCQRIPDSDSDSGLEIGIGFDARV